MDRDARDSGPGVLSPEAAFSVLGDETRLQILQVLGAAEWDSDAFADPIRDLLEG